MSLGNVLWFIVVVLVILWLLGFSFNVGGGLIHLLIVIVVLIVVYNLFINRRGNGGGPMV